MDQIITMPSTLLTVARAADMEDRQHEFIISDETPDSFGTVFKIGGWDLSRRSLKKRVTYGHPDYNVTDPDVIIGTGDERIEGLNLISRLTLESEDMKNDLADKVHKKLLKGTLTDASIRARILDGRMGEEKNGENSKYFYFTRMELIDWGVVMEGSNPAAVKTREAVREIIKHLVPQDPAAKDMARALAVRYYTM